MTSVLKSEGGSVTSTVRSMCPCVHFFCGSKNGVIHCTTMILFRVMPFSDDEQEVVKEISFRKT